LVSARQASRLRKMAENNENKNTICLWTTMTSKRRAVLRQNLSGQQRVQP
jgi:hypothetical protein